MEPVVEARVFCARYFQDVHHLRRKTLGFPVAYEDGDYVVHAGAEKAFTLRPGKLAIIQREEMTYVLKLVAPPDPIEAPWEVDHGFVNIFAFVTFFMLTAITALKLAPDTSEVLDELTLSTSPRFAPLLEAPKVAARERETMRPSEPAAPKAKRPAVRVRSSASPDRSGLLNAMGRGGFSALLRDTTLIGDEVSQALADLRSGRGVASIGVVEARAGNGGFDAPGSLEGIPSAGIRTRGRGVSDGSEVAQLSPRRERDVVIYEQAPTAVGALPPELIAQVMRENRNAFRYCYERALQVEKSLEGKVKLQFVIGAAGNVISAAVKETSLSKADVQECLMQRVRALTFAAPRGGGVVIVTYPFVFKSR